MNDEPGQFCCHTPSHIRFKTNLTSNTNVFFPLNTSTVDYDNGHGLDNVFLAGQLS